MENMQEPCELKDLIIARDYVPLDEYRQQELSERPRNREDLGCRSNT